MDNMCIPNNSLLTKDSEYSAKDIHVLEGLEAVRKRPGMYIGDQGPRGLHHLVYEVVDNSIDESLAGFCDTITVTINGDGSVTVVDNGRGIPTENHESGKSAEVVADRALHTGSKFGKSAYRQIQAGFMSSEAYHDQRAFWGTHMEKRKGTPSAL